MITQHQKELLVDLAKLFDKYGTKPFEELADLLSSPETIQLWAGFLRDSSLTARKAGFEQSGNQKQQPRRTVKSELERIKSENPEKYQALTRFYDALRSKIVLPNLGDIRNFAQDRGLPVITAKSREKAISPLIRSIIPLDINMINDITESLPHSHTESFSKSSLAAREAGFEQSGKREQQLRRTVKSELERIKSENPDKHQALTRFYNALRSKAILPNLGDIRNFVQDRGLPVITAKSRDKAISPLVQSMIPLDINMINDITESLPHSHTESFNDLEGWTRIIMDKKRR